jgi:hypothetical protein
MSKRIINRVDPNNVFLEGMHDPEAIFRMTKSCLWPVAVSIHVSSCAALPSSPIRVGRYTASKQPDIGGIIPEKMELTTSEGFVIGSISHADGKYVVRSTPGGDFLQTENRNYAITKLGSKGISPVRDKLLEQAKDTVYNMNRYLRCVIDNTIDQGVGTSLSMSPQVENLSARSITALSRFFSGDIEKNTIHPTLQSEMAHAFSIFKSKNDKFLSAVDSLNTGLKQDKFLLFTSVSGGIVLAKINTKAMLNSTRRYVEDSRLPHMDEGNTSARKWNYFNDESIIMPLKWYKGIEHVPADIRPTLEIQLVMLKAHVGHSNLLPTKADDQFRESGVHMFTALDAFVSNWNLTNDSLMLLVNA